MGSLFMWSLLALFCLIPSCLILMWSSSSPPTTAGTWWEAAAAAAAAAVHSQKPAGFTGGSPAGNNIPSQPHGEEANHHLPSWLFSGAAAVCPATGAVEAPASGCIACQGDGRDQATYWLLTWLGTCALVNFLGRCAKLTWAVFVLMVRTLWEAKRRARPGPPAPVLRDNVMEGGPANAAEPALVPPPQQQGTENVPGAAGEAGRGAEVESSPIVAAVFSGSAILLSLRPPPPFQGRSISAPEPFISTPVAVTAANGISGDVSPASAASRVRANTIGKISYATACIIDNGNGGEH